MVRLHVRSIPPQPHRWPRTASTNVQRSALTTQPTRTLRLSRHSLPHHQRRLSTTHCILLATLPTTNYRTDGLSLRNGPQSPSLRPPISYGMVMWILGVGLGTWDKGRWTIGLMIDRLVHAEGIWMYLPSGLKFMSYLSAFALTQYLPFISAPHLPSTNSLYHDLFTWNLATATPICESIGCIREGPKWGTATITPSGSRSRVN